MKYGLYCIYNLDTQEFSAPIVFKTEKMAINSFVRHIEVSYKKDKRFFCPADYDLFLVGTFSDSKGEVVGKEHSCVMLGANVDLSFVEDDNKDKDKDKSKSDADWVVEDDTWTVDDDEDED